MTRPGTPTMTGHGAATVPSRTTAPAPTIEWSPMLQPIRTTRVCAQMAMVADAGGPSFDFRVLAFADDATHCRVRIDLDAARDVTAFADCKAPASVQHREGPDPAALADLWFADDPCLGVVGVRWQPMSVVVDWHELPLVNDVLDGGHDLVEFRVAHPGEKVEA